jgi:hypothetical protein
MAKVFLFVTFSLVKYFEHTSIMLIGIVCRARLLETFDLYAQAGAGFGAHAADKLQSTSTDAGQ